MGEHGGARDKLSWHGSESGLVEGMETWAILRKVTLGWSSEFRAGRPLCVFLLLHSLRWASPEQSLTVTWRAGGMVVVRCWWWWVVSCRVLLVRVSTKTSRYVVAVFRHHVFGVLSSSHQTCRGRSLSRLSS